MSLLGDSLEDSALGITPHDLQIGLASHRGRVRERNEDSSLALQFVLAQQDAPPLPVGLFALADGMGGHAQGEEASALAIRLATRHILSNVYLPLLSDSAGTPWLVPINEALENSMHVAHQAVLHRFPKAGSTLTVALTLGDGVYIGHVGDSRAYLGERGSLQCLTRDHSMAERLLEVGGATSDEARLQRNVLYKALGHGAHIEPDILYHDMWPEQHLLLCCDGLWDKVSDKRMAAIIETSASPGIACRNLVAEANKNGGEDNISVILAARCWPPPAREQPS